MKPAFFYQVVAPTTLNGAALIGITTLAAQESNFVNELIRARHDNGRLVYRIIALEMVCEACREAGKAAECRHRDAEYPYWQRLSKHKDLEAIMKGSARLEDWQREARGLQTSSTTRPVFLPADCAMLLEPSTFHIEHGHSVRHVFTTVDPSACGKFSAFAMVSCIYKDVPDGAQCIIVAADVAVKDSFQENFECLRQHLASVARVLPGLQQPTYVFIPESNLGLESSHMEAYLTNTYMTGHDKPPLPNGVQAPTNFCVMHEDTEGRAGIKMSYTLKEQLVAGLEFRLKRRRICFHRNFITTSDKHTPRTMQNYIVDQLRSFASHLKYPKNGDEHAMPKRIYSGKAAGMDDMVIALMLNPSMHALFWSNASKYGAYH